MKRIGSFIIAMLLLLGAVSLSVVNSHAASAFVTSDACIEVLKAEEGFSRTPYWDFTQYTVGYGTSCPSDMVEYYTQNGITEAEAETLLRNHLSGVEHHINTRIIDKYALTLTQNQFDALVLFSYNCGTSWTYETTGTFHNAIVKGATGNDLIRAFALWCSAGNQIRTFLLRRRLSEANMYLNGIYDMNPPENYCYVLYDANGGSVSPRSQGYDANLNAAPFPVPTKDGYTFDGWHTAKNGGTKVTVLDMSVKGLTLYAQWKDGEGNTTPPVNNEPTADKPVTVTVTGIDVNLRNGPGTNYTRVGVAAKGQQLVITEVADGTGYTWGKCESGWIALQYTDYDTVINNQTQNPGTEPPATEPPATEPPATEPPATEPPATEPPATEPPATEPPATEPPTTEPPATEPPATEPPATEPPATEPKPEKITGTVNVQDWLRVRSGPGTSYSIVGYLKPKQKVEILEQSTVGNQKWAKIAEGWVSMDYIILDKTTTNNTGSTTTTQTTWTGKVIADELLIRNGPGTKYSVVSYLKYGTAVTITEKKSDGSRQWGKIANGWICLDYVQMNASSGSTSSGSTSSGSTSSGSTSSGSTSSGSTSSGSTSSGSTSQTTTITGTVNVTDFLCIRTGAGTNYTVVGHLKPKEKVTITEKKTVNGRVWGKTSKGWVCMDYIIVDKSSTSTSTTTVTKTITADCLNVRSNHGTAYSIVGYLYYGAKVEILETAKASDGSLWGRIAKGWIHMGYTK